MEFDRRTHAIVALLGLSTGVAVGFWLWTRRAAAVLERADRQAPPGGSAQAVLEAIRREPGLSGGRIEVEPISEGVIELGGSVPDRAEAERAVEIAQGTAGVHTVLNRIDVELEESHREESRRRWSEGAPELNAGRHYGMGVGMGTRRQSPATDPDRPSDKQHLLERELDVAKMEDEAVPAAESDADEPTPDRHPETGSGVGEEGQQGEGRT